MAARTRPYEQFGPYLLFRKFDSDALGDLWRAAAVEGNRLTAPVALRRLSGGNRAALAAATTHAGAIVPQLSGASFVRNQVAGTVDGIPFVAWEYGAGRSLRTILDRARGTRETQNHLPLDQAIAIAERVALSAATMSDLRDTAGNRLSHGALLPQFVWISDEGEIRVAGQQLATGIVTSLTDPRVAAEFSAWFAPEARGSREPGNDVYSLGALLYLLVTGNEPPDAANASAFGAAVRAARMAGGSPIPDDIRTILDKSFNVDPSMRYRSIADLKQALTSLANGGRYSATTFNLAFYLSSLLKKELEEEAAEIEREGKVPVATYLEAPRAVPSPAEPPPPAPIFAAAIEQEKKKKSRVPLYAAAAIAVVAAGGAGAWMMLSKTQSAPVAAVTTAQVIPQRRPQPIAEPLVASATPEEAGTATDSSSSAGPDTDKAAFEAAVREKLQAEMMKLQSDYMAELKKRQSSNAPIAASAPAVQATATAEERAAPSAAQLDQQRRDAQAASEPAAALQQTQTAAAPVQPSATPATAAATPARQPSAAVREGDVVDYADLDEAPKPVRAVLPVYPTIARQQKIAATVFMTILVTESGEVAEVKVLRGDPRFGINDAAIRAMKATRFTAPVKEGKRVRTWFPQTIQFRP